MRVGVTNYNLFVLVKVGLTEKTLKEVGEGAMQKSGGRALQAEGNAKTGPRGRSVSGMLVVGMSGRIQKGEASEAGEE